MNLHLRAIAQVPQQELPRREEAKPLLLRLQDSLADKLPASIKYALSQISSELQKGAGVGNILSVGQPRHLEQSIAKWPSGPSLLEFLQPHLTLTQEAEHMEVDGGGGLKGCETPVVLLEVR